MADIFSPERRSQIMQAIRGHNTKPELKVRSVIHQMGFRFRLHRHDLPGRPDIVLPKHRKIVLVHGCFWHGHLKCKIAHRPKSNEGYWGPKLERTVKRDAKNIEELKKLGWNILVIWECQIRNMDTLLATLANFLNPNLEDG